MRSSVQSTLTVNESLRTEWDVVVVGAGPAGSMAARNAVKLGLRVLLLDRERFPRPKVCGCCVNPAALGLLEPEERSWLESHGCPLRRYELAVGGRVASIPPSDGLAISRELLDSQLIDAAIQSGVQFLDATQATLGSNTSGCRLELKRGHEEGTVRGRVAVLATGLGGKCLSPDGDKFSRPSSRSYVGGGVTLEPKMSGFEPGVVSMACHRSGYVGMVLLEDGRLDLAGAFDVGFVKQCGGLSHAARRVVSEAGFAVPQGMQDQPWQGTVRLTHRRAKLFGDGYLVAGDAAGYVEPFTGEGIAWAMASGRAVASFAARAGTEAMAAVGPAWSQEYRRILGRRQRTCRAVSLLLRQPLLMRLAVSVLKTRPQLATPIEHYLSTPFAIVD